MSKLELWKRFFAQPGSIVASTPAGFVVMRAKPIDDLALAVVRDAGLRVRQTADVYEFALEPESLLCSAFIATQIALIAALVAVVFLTAELAQCQRHSRLYDFSPFTH